MRRLSPLVLAFALLFGCTTGPGVKVHLDPATVAAISGEATRLGSLTTLAIHPDRSSNRPAKPSTSSWRSAISISANSPPF
jgi:hypothetical protein